MNSDTFERAASIFVDAAALARDEQDAFVRDACGSDAELLREVRSLLQASDGADAYFADLADRLGFAANAAEGGGRPVIGEAGYVIGAYTLTEPVGSGGAGTVWRAERTDGQFEGHVAIKLVNPLLALGAATERIADEARHLAKLSHPNIARLLDAGVDSENRRYLVLEYVDGTRIDEFCDRENLGVGERIALFVDVLRAVAHAHARLIVHRDIKPSNVLVARNGAVKLLDFGIATLLRDGDAKGAATVELGTALTPEYAAPEQLLGQQVTTATDVYALGLMLYELLAGGSPRGEATIGSYAELVEVATQDPPKASATAADRASRESLRRQLRGDLDCILQKALAPNPERRYGTATEFAADLERYLRGEAVSAVPPSLAYRARKFVSRHRGGVATTVLTAIALVVALSFAVQQMFEARKQRDLALYQQQRVHASNEFYSLLIEEMGSEDESFTAIELLDRGYELLDLQFDADQPFIGRIHYDLSRRYSNMRERTRELELLSRAERTARVNDDDDLLAAALCSTGWTYRFSDLDRSRELALEGNQALARVAAPSIDSVIACMRLNSVIAEADGSRERAIEILREARRLLDETAAAPTHLRGITLNDLAGLLYKEARYAECLDVNADTLEMLDENGRGGTLVYLQLLSNRATVLGAVGEWRAQFDLQEELQRRLDGRAAQPGRARVQYDTAYGISLLRMSRHDDSIRVLQAARETASDLGNPGAVAMANMYLSNVYVEAGRFDDAEASMQAIEGMFAQNPTAFERQRVGIDIMRATIDRKEGRLDEARARLESLLENYNYPPLSIRSSSMAALLKAVTDLELDAGNYPAAETLATDYLSIQEGGQRRSDSSAFVGSALVLRAKARHGQGDVAAAIEDLVRAIPALETGAGAEHPQTLEAQGMLEEYRQSP